MATGGVPSPDDWKMHLTCSLCLDIFTNPKLIPGCLHTYCLKCLEELVSRYKDKFPCPECRAEIKIPVGGVATFQTNRFLRSEDIDRAHHDTECPTHPKMEEDMYCVTCNTLLCPKCALKNHKLHAVKEIYEALKETKTENVKRPEVPESFTTGKAGAEEKEQQALQDDKIALKTAINNRRVAYIAKVNKIHDDLLTALDVTCSEIEADINKQLDLKQKNRDQLRHLEQPAQQVGNDTNSSTRPVVSFKNTACAVERQMEEVMLGTPGKMESTSPEVNVKEQFRCCPAQDKEVFFLCPINDGEVWVSSAQRESSENATREIFKNDGTSLDLVRNRGLATCKARRNGKEIVLSRKQVGLISTVSKSPSTSSTYIYLMYRIPSTLSKVVQATVVSENPFQTDQKSLFKIRQEGPQRAFDVNTTQQLFVVLDDTQAPEKRRLFLYQRDEENAVAIYNPPSTSCRPSDVCFMTLGGEEVLLVSDEATDSIHVVRMQQGSLAFLRYLAPGCPLLKQPTALNTDFEGRLWVACRGGAILTMTPLK